MTVDTSYLLAGAILAPATTFKEEVVKTCFLEGGDILTTSLMNLCFGKSARDCWNMQYPLAVGP